MTIDLFKKIIHRLFILNIIFNIQVCTSQEIEQFKLTGEDYSLLKIAIDEFALKIKENWKPEYQTSVSKALSNIDNYDIRVFKSDSSFIVSIYPDFHDDKNNIGIIKDGITEYHIDRKTRKIVPGNFQPSNINEVKGIKSLTKPD